MAEAKRRKRRPKHSSMHMTVWSMNGEPIPQETIQKLEAVLSATMRESKVRLVHNVVRF